MAWNAGALYGLHRATEPIKDSLTENTMAGTRWRNEWGEAIAFMESARPPALRYRPGGTTDESIKLARSAAMALWIRYGALNYVFEERKCGNVDRPLCAVQCIVTAPGQPSSLDFRFAEFLWLIFLYPNNMCY